MVKNTEYFAQIAEELQKNQGKSMYYLPRFSPNHNARPFTPVSLIVLHYTGMKNAKEALEWLCNAESGVSAHYFVEENGDISELVEEDRRAWHAGVSSWAGAHNINDISIGIELVNGGHEHGYAPFPPAQIAATIQLCGDIMRRHELRPACVIGHSDVAPTRKSDPGELFPWEKCAKYGIGLWHDIMPYQPEELDSLELEPQQLKELQAFGYGIEQENPNQIQAVITAFQRHFRTSNISGKWDNECKAVINSLLKKL
jgi:N-acetylmuramoyl-L-alanine amidase